MIKNIILTLLTTTSLALAASQDFSKGVDFSGRTNITQATLNQLVDSATPATNRGLVIITNGAPSVANDPKLSRYIWLNTAVNPPSINIWDTNSSLWVSNNVAAGSIGTAQLADGAVTTIKIANSAVDNSKLANDSVNSAKIVDGSIATADYGNNSITREKLYPALISSEQLTNSAVQGTNIAALSISNSHLAIGFQVFNTNIAANSINNTNLQANAVQGTNIASGSISNNHISSMAITTNNLATNITTLLPRVFATLDSSGNILRGIGFSGAVRTSAGDYTLTFASAPGFTNYCVQSMTMDFGGSAGDIGVSVSSNTTTTVSVNCWVRGTGADVDPDLLYITVQY